MDNREPFISIIVPVYNTEQYLKRCLDSVVNQTFKDIEIIIVNDCSPKNCNEIVKEYNDERIVYIKHDINKGTLASRKTGSINANGKYITYLDSDDELYINACQLIYDEYKKIEVDIIHFSAEAVLDDNLNISAKEKTKAVNKVEWYLSSSRNLINEKYLFYEVAQEKLPHNMCGKAYKNELIKKSLDYIPDVRLNNAEDMLQFLITIYFASSYSAINNKLYIYHISIGESSSNRDSSLMSVEKYDILCKGSSIACNEFLSFLKKQGAELLYGFYYYTIYYNQYRFLKEKIVNNENKNKFIDVLESYFDVNIINMYLNLKEYEDLKIQKEKNIINKLTPYFFSIIMYEYYINIKILGIKINLKNNKCLKEPKIISFNSLLKNIFSINTDNKNDKYIKILFIKVKL
ncbi:glycosyltransferase family 2 protein [Brachyspira alvinipulli]|uniref:glycosyltransferase family 2 protein n=1 Tax=Brachyspira alvinipulli TaxID=84379 RepID=UPI000484B52B|nr:glycosyltransferase family 2 protein [Brachyspira alvinipulli]